MGTKRKDPFEVERRKAYARAKCQADFRQEEWQLSYEDYCEFWPDPHIWNQRGRKLESLVLARYDDSRGWNRSNVAQITRSNQLQIKVRRKQGQDYSQYFHEARWLL